MDVAATLDELLTVEAQTSRLKSRAQELRADLLAEARNQAELTGALPSWRVKGKGTVTLVQPEPTLSVVDETAFTVWVGEEHLDWLVSVVDPARRQQLLQTARPVDGGVVVTPDGEPMPGVRVAEKPPYLQVRVAAAAKEAAGRV